jgi:hypothetical protein
MFLQGKAAEMTEPPPEYFYPFLFDDQNRFEVLTQASCSLRGACTSILPETQKIERNTNAQPLEPRPNPNLCVSAAVLQTAVVCIACGSSPWTPVVWNALSLSVLCHRVQISPSGRVRR